MVAHAQAAILLNNKHDLCCKQVRVTMKLEYELLMVIINLRGKYKQQPHLKF